MKLTTLFENNDQYENLPYASNEAKLHILKQRKIVITKRAASLFDEYRDANFANDNMKSKLEQLYADKKRITNEIENVKSTMDKYLKDVIVIRCQVIGTADSYTYFRMFLGSLNKPIKTWEARNFSFSPDAKEACNFVNTPEGKKEQRDILNQMRIVFPNYKCEVVTMKVRK